MTHGEQARARIAFVGAGNHSTASLYPNIAQIPEFDLACVCDLDEDKARDVAARFGARAWYTDVEAMLDQEPPDGVCVCGQPEMHHVVALQALQRGIPVFVEKPPAPTLAQARELAATATRQGTWGMVGFMKRFAPANLVALDYMGSQAFGDLSSITLIHGSGPYDDMRRMLMFNGIHMIDTARFLAGDVASVFAVASGADRAVQAISVAMRFASGAVGQLNMNSGHSWQDCFEQVYISGSESGLVIDASQAVEVMSQQREFARPEGPSLFGFSGRYYVSGNMAGWEAGGHYTRGYWGELSRFARAVCGLDAPGPTLEDAVAAMSLIDAIMGSAEQSRPVSPA